MLAVLLSGCPRDEPATPTDAVENASATPRASVALKVLVVNDPKLAEAINRLRGEWAERSGGTLSVESTPWADVAEADSIDADVVIFPARYLGDLVERKQLRPMRESAIRGRLYDADDVLPLVRQKLGTYGRRTMALPLSVETLLARYPLELAEQAVARLETWRALREDGRELRIWPARDAIAHWPAIVLLARAAPYASHQQQESVLFDPQTMKPRIAEAPFVRALNEWREQAKANPADSNSPQGERLGWAELPGADQVFNRSSGEWEPAANGSKRVPLLAGGDLLGVAASSRNAASAFDLSVWLASGEIGRQLGPIGKGSLPVRRSLLSTSGRWIDSSAGESDGSQVAGVLQTAMSRDEAQVVPRIPGTDEYLSALAEAVEKAHRDEASAADALGQAAAAWDDITERFGKEAQRQAYLRDLGLEQP